MLKFLFYLYCYPSLSDYYLTWYLLKIHSKFTNSPDTCMYNSLGALEFCLGMKFIMLNMLFPGSCWSYTWCWFLTDDRKAGAIQWDIRGTFILHLMLFKDPIWFSTRIGLKGYKSAIFRCLGKCRSSNAVCWYVIRLLLFVDNSLCTVSSFLGMIVWTLTIPCEWIRFISIVFI